MLVVAFVLVHIGVDFLLKEANSSGAKIFRPRCVFKSVLRELQMRSLCFSDKSDQIVLRSVKILSISTCRMCNCVTVLADFSR